MLPQYAMNDPSVPPVLAEASQPPALTSDERMWACLGHLSALSGILTSFIGNIVGPLIVWQVKKDTMPVAAEQAKEALNFNISWFIWGLLLTAVMFALMLVVVGFLLIPLVAIYPIVWFVFSVIGGLKANEGKAYRYPLTIRFIQ